MNENETLLNIDLSYLIYTCLQIQTTVVMSNTNMQDSVEFSCGTRVMTSHWPGVVFQECGNIGDKLPNYRRVVLMDYGSIPYLSLDVDTLTKM